MQESDWEPGSPRPRCALSSASDLVKSPAWNFCPPKAKQERLPACCRLAPAAIVNRNQPEGLTFGRHLHGLALLWLVLFVSLRARREPLCRLECEDRLWSQDPGSPACSGAQLGGT